MYVLNGIPELKEIGREATVSEGLKPFTPPDISSADLKFTVECSKKASRKAIRMFRKESNVLRRRVRYMHRFKERRRRAVLKGQEYVRISAKYVILFNPLVFREEY